MIFLCFSTDFTRISKNRLLFEIRFCEQALGSFSSSQRYPRFTQNTLGRTGGLQCGPCHGRWRRRPKSGGSRGGVGRGKRGGGLGAHRLPVCGPRWAEERRQLAGRRRVGTAATTSSAPANAWLGVKKKRRRKLS
jgi:hypothetical protein